MVTRLANPRMMSADAAATPTPPAPTIPTLSPAIALNLTRVPGSRASHRRPPAGGRYGFFVLVVGVVLGDGVGVVGPGTTATPPKAAGAESNSTHVRPGVSRTAT